MADSVADKIESFFSQTRLRKYAKGQVLILNGDDATYVYHLVQGTVKQYDVTYRGDEITLNVFKPPAFFPMSLAINGGINPYIYEAETDIEVHQVPAKEAVMFIKDNPDVMFDLLSRVYHGVDGLIGRTAQLMSGSARSRLIYELITEALRFGTKKEDGSYVLNSNEKELGARSGLSRETVSREIHKLKLENLITVDRRGVVVNSLKLLEKKLVNH